MGTSLAVFWTALAAVEHPQAIGLQYLQLKWKAKLKSISALDSTPVSTPKIKDSHNTSWTRLNFKTT